MLKTVRAIEAGDYPQLPQDESGEIKHAPKIFKETCEIDWKKPTEEVYNFIRGLSPYPAAWTTINDKNFKIFATKKLDSTVKSVSGEYKTDNKTFLHIHTGTGALAITELQMEGKKRMDVESFLRGTQL